MNHSLLDAAMPSLSSVATTIVPGGPLTARESLLSQQLGEARTVNSLLMQVCCLVGPVGYIHCKSYDAFFQN